MSAPGAFKIILAAGLWRGVDVLVEPPTSTRLPRHFREHGAAMAFAEELAKVEGWPIVDRCTAGN